MGCQLSIELMDCEAFDPLVSRSLWGLRQQRRISDIDHFGGGKGLVLDGDGQILLVKWEVAEVQSRLELAVDSIQPVVDAIRRLGAQRLTERQ
ncbi:MAG: hypothetical protein JF888_00905 [Candidatus Dormibacteraeota bacterium]|uniref:Uncharacterized protein n=1 Tax=Candidatus Dormiibacter inghamiae TaxID=3127013 RepID=A0A934KBG7_9BACT|nr:hypothetical protein [Candidatus Dormibacteraeota bacterium]MBJ7605897.1 hypothetical protein [Candidatus Dormibacteraeota bacterium]